MKVVRALLAGLVAFLAPGPAAWGQMARSVPVSGNAGVAAPVVPVAPGRSSLAPLSPSVAPTLGTLPSVSLPEARTALPVPAVRAVPAAMAAALARSGNDGPAVAAPAAWIAPDLRARPLGRLQDLGGGTPSEVTSVAERTARETLVSDAQSVARAKERPQAVLDVLFDGGSIRSTFNDNAAVAPSAPNPAPFRLLKAVPGAASEKAEVVPEAKPNAKALGGLFFSRTVSIASFVLTSIAYPFLAVPVVGWEGFGALMAFGPLAALATGPLNGYIAARLSARKAMGLNAAVRAALSLVLPAAAAFGVLNFWTLLAASVANGWIMNSVMTTEGAYLKTLATPKHLGTVNGLAWMNYLAIQVVLGLILGVGSVVDAWDPSAAFYVSAAVHAFIVLPVLWFTMPDLAPPLLAKARAAGRSFAGWLKTQLLPLAAAAAGLAAYAAFSTTLPLIGAILFWVSRTQGFQDLWSGRSGIAGDGRLRNAMLFLSLAALFLFPLQYFVLPAAATALAGAAGKGLLLGRFLGALFLGNLVSVAANSRLPELTLFGRKVQGRSLAVAAVAALAAGWSLAALAPGSLLAAAAVSAAVLGLARLAGRLSETGWLKLMGPGFAAVALPYAVWTLGLFPAFGVEAALSLSLLAAGMVYGPAFVALNTYFQRWTSPDRMGPAIGAQGSFFNGAVSLGYGLISLAASFAPLPGLLGWLALAYAAVGLLFWFAPRALPGLPAGMLRSGEP